MKIEAIGKVFYLDFEHHTKAEKPCTLAILYDASSKEIGRGVAHCHPTDVFNKVKGRKIALTKLLYANDVALATITHGHSNTDNRRQIRGAVWHEYLKKARV
jgi:hypothetical protein